MKRFVWFLEAVLLIFLSLPLAILPLRLSLKAGEMLGLLLFYIWGSRRRIAIENIKLAAIEIHQPAMFVAKETFKNLGKSFAEVIKIYFGLGEKIINSVEVEGAENLNKAKGRGNGVIFITGHCGNWELLAITASAKLIPCSVVARPINNPYLNSLIERTRQKYGNSVIYKKGALKDILKKLKNGDCVGILMDQSVVADEGYIIDFLGMGAWTTKMPALIARKTDAAVLPVFIHRTLHGHKMVIYPEFRLSDITNTEDAVKEDTKKFSSTIEQYIQSNPSEWLWIHRRWKRVKP